MSDARPSRTYRSPRREESARQTRAAILDVAAELFVANGYGGTSVDAPIPVMQRPAYVELLAEPDPYRTVRLLARNATALLSRYSALDDTATDLVWLSIASTNHFRLVPTLGWSDDRFEQWLGDVLTYHLLPAATNKEKER